MSSKRKVLFFVGCLIGAMGIAWGQGNAGDASPATLAVRIMDERGNAVAARVYLTDSEGQPRFPATGCIVYRKIQKGVAEEHFVPRAGAFEIGLPGGDWRIVVERGKEYRPIKDLVRVPTEGRVERTYQLERWVAMKDRGWYSGDMHFHRPLRDAAVLMEAEDLDMAIPITRWRTGRGAIAEDPDLNDFLARADEHGALSPSGGRWFTVLNEELESTASALLGSHLGKQRSALDYPFATYGRALLERGALADSEKATSLELPVAAALGGCDLVGLANNHFWRGGWPTGAWGAWPDRLPGKYPDTFAGFALAGFDIYYALLNVGLPLKLSAGSASGVHPVPPGWSRIYVHVPGTFTVDRWFEGVKHGRSFVTTGPMLLLKANGLEPGEESRAERFPLNVKVTVELLSPKPVRSLEIIVNGKASTLMVTAQPRGLYSANTQITLKTSSWIAARWLEGTGSESALAHTSPVYFWNGNQPIPVRRADAEYLLQRVDALIRDAEAIPTEQYNGASRIVMSSASQREETMRLLHEARGIYQRKLEQASPE